MAMLLRRATCSLAAYPVLAAAGCMGGDDRSGTPSPASGRAPTERVDSAERFRGERRAVAEVIERFESATRRGDRRQLCSRLLAVAEAGFGARLSHPERACRRDPEFAPGRELHEAGGKRGYDLVVERVRVRRRSDRFKPDAIARVRMPEGAGAAVEIWEFREVDGRWKVYARYGPRLRERPGPDLLECPDGSRTAGTSIDSFVIGRDARPRPAREALERRQRALERGRRQGGDRDEPVPLEARALASEATELSRLGVSYGYGDVTYELSSQNGVILALFDLVRIRGLYHLWRTQTCPRLIRSEVLGREVGDPPELPAADLGDWRVRVSVAPPRVGPLEISVEDAAAAAATEGFSHDLVLRNTGDRPLTFDDTRSSAFVGDSDKHRLLVATPGCGYSINRPGAPVRAGTCHADLRVRTLRPGRAIHDEISVSFGLEGMDRFVPGTYTFRHLIRFQPGHDRPTGDQGRQRKLRLTYSIRRTP